MLTHRRRHDTGPAEPLKEFAEPKCPEVLKHPIWSPGVMLLILVAEAFVLGMLAGKALCHL